MKVLITGGSGQLGRALAQSARVECLACDRGALDVTEFDTVRALVSEYRPDLIIHAGAMTDVDGCERDPKSAWKANALGTQNVAASATENHAALVYISTNFIFDGEQDEPYHEFARPNPISVYGASKLAGEEVVRSICPRHFIVRTSMVYDETGKNFVNTMLRLAEDRSTVRVVADQYGNPTYAVDLADAIWRLVQRPSFGTFHLTNSGIATWHDWAVELFRLADKPINVEAITAVEFQRAATPPRNGVLANLSAAALGITLPDWKDALARCVTSRATMDSDK